MKKLSWSHTRKKQETSELMEKFVFSSVEQHAKFIRRLLEEILNDLAGLIRKRKESGALKTDFTTFFLSFFDD